MGITEMRTLSLRQLVIAIGIIGTIAFLGIGLSNVLPWVFAGPVAATFVTGWILNELREYLKGRTTTSPQKEPEAKPRTKQARTVSLENSPLEEAVTMPPKSSRRYQAILRKGELLTVEAGADDWISVELVNRSGYAERGKDGKNLTIQYESKRNGNWFIYVHNDNKTSLEVGVTLTVEA